MKKIVLSLFALLSAVVLFSKEVTPEQAMQYARKFFSDTPSARLSLVWKGGELSSPAFYVINRAGGGFLILSGDDAVTPVMGYSYTGSFETEGMPEQMRGWFSSLEEDFATVRRLRPVPSREVTVAWETLGVRTKAGEKSLLLESAQWDQGYPYNEKCVMPDGSKAVTGCVATAMAIVLRYNKYPAHGYGSLRTYTTNTYKYRIEGYSIEDHTYNWDQMPLQVTRSITAEQIEQISQLIHDCGVMVQMDYSRGGSGAISMNMPAQIAEHMAYSPEALLYRKSMYKPREWIDLIKKELQQNRLVFYSAQDKSGSGGHAFVIDGYDENDLLHVNWGWSGHGNAFFNLDLEVDGYRFSESQGAVLGLVPDPSRTKQAVTYLALTGTGLTLASGRIEEGQTFSLDVNTITNYGNAAYSGPVVVVLTDENSNIKSQVSSPKSIEVPALSSASTSISNCKLETKPAFKDRIALAGKNSLTGEYEVLRSDVEAESVGSLATIPNFIAGKSSYSVGESFSFVLFKSGEKLSSIKWYFDGSLIPADVDSVTLTAGNHVVKAVINKGNGTETIVREIEVK